MDQFDDQDTVTEVPILSDASIHQQTTRSCVEGFDCLSVMARIQFPVDSDRQVLHIPICPAMDEIPEVDAYVVDGCDARVRVTQVQKFGTRLELIRSSSESKELAESIVEIVLRSKIESASQTPQQQGAA